PPALQSAQKILIKEPSASAASPAAARIPTAWWAAVEANLQQQAYAFNLSASEDGVYQASNLAQRLHVSFHPGGLQVSPENDRPTHPNTPSPASSEIKPNAPDSDWNWS